MTTAPAPHSGRPTKPRKPGTRSTVSIRLIAETHEQLIAVAKSKGRPLSQEIELRLERTLREENLFERMFGSREAFVRAIALASEHSRSGERAASDKGLSPDAWRTDGNCFETALTSLVFAELQQHPDPEPDIDDFADRLKDRWRARKLSGPIPPKEAGK